jgi:hypothetical protein
MLAEWGQGQHLPEGRGQRARNLLYTKGSLTRSYLCSGPCCSTQAKSSKGEELFGVMPAEEGVNRVRPHVLQRP